MDKLVIRATARTFKFAPEADYIMSQYYLWNMRRWSGAEIFFFAIPHLSENSCKEREVFA